MQRIMQVSMERTQYLNDNNWIGSCYELAIEYYPGGNDARLLKALNAVWNELSLAGPWLSVDGFLGTDRMPEILDEANSLYGLLRLPDGKTVGCRTTTAREEGHEGSDWLKFSIPVRMLALSYHINHPIDQSRNDWLLEVDRVLIRIGQMVYDSYPFSLAIIGEDISGYVHERNLFPSDMNRGSYLIPPILYERLRPNRTNEVLSGGLRWFPVCTR